MRALYKQPAVRFSATTASVAGRRYDQVAEDGTGRRVRTRYIHGGDPTYSDRRAVCQQQLCAQLSSVRRSTTWSCIMIQLLLLLLLLLRHAPDCSADVIASVMPSDASLKDNGYLSLDF